MRGYALFCPNFLTKEQIDYFECFGFLHLRQAFSNAEVQEIGDATERVFETEVGRLTGEEYGEVDAIVERDPRLTQLVTDERTYRFRAADETDAWDPGRVAIFAVLESMILIRALASVENADILIVPNKLMLNNWEATLRRVDELMNRPEPFLLSEIQPELKEIADRLPTDIVKVTRRFVGELGQPKAEEFAENWLKRVRPAWRALRGAGQEEAAEPAKA